MAVCVRTPCPELTALVDVVVAGEHCTCIYAMVITSYEIILKVMDEHRVSGERRKILPPADVSSDKFRVALVWRLRHRPMDMAELVVEHTELCILREDDLVVLVCVSCHIVPMEHRVTVDRVVEETACNLDIRLVRMKGQTHCPAHSVAVLDLTHPDCL